MTSTALLSCGGVGASFALPATAAVSESAAYTTALERYHIFAINAAEKAPRSMLKWRSFLSETIEMRLLGVSKTH